MGEGASVTSDNYCPYFINVGPECLVTCLRWPKHYVTKTAFEPLSPAPLLACTRQPWNQTGLGLNPGFDTSCLWDWQWVTSFPSAPNSSSVEMTSNGCSQGFGEDRVRQNIRSVQRHAWPTVSASSMPGTWTYCNVYCSYYSAHSQRYSRFPKEERFLKAGTSSFLTLEWYIYDCQFPGNRIFFFLSGLQCVNVHKRTLPCLKAKNSCSESMCCRELLKQSHTLATKFVFWRVALDPWQYLLLKRKCFRHWVLPHQFLLLWLWNYKSVDEIRESHPVVYQQGSKWHRWHTRIWG